MLRRVLVAAMLSVGMAVSGTAIAAQAASAPAVAAPATHAAPTAPTLDCEPGIVNQICTALAPVICRTSCAAPPTVSAPAAAAPRSGMSAAAPKAATAMAAPTFYCDVPVLCQVLAATICRDRCFFEGAAAAAVPPFQDLCTINIRPINPFCLLP